VSRLSPRKRYEQTERRRSLIIATASLLAVSATLAYLIPKAPGWLAVKRSFLSLPLILILALAIALCRNVQSAALFPLRVFGALYTDIFRGVPTILLIYLIGFGIPGLGLPRPWNSPYLWGTVALVLTYSAYVAEVLRAGISSVHQSQRAASESLGLSEADTMRFVILPQAIRRQVPAMMNFVIALQKDVALLSFIGPVELLRQANVYKSLMANFTPYIGAAIIFLCVTIPATRYADYLLAKQHSVRT